MKRRLGWPEVKRFYEARSAHWAQVADHKNDPDALQNVMAPGQPLWRNRYLARNQERAYQALFDLLPPPQRGARALDIGCGSGRWCRFLSHSGYRVVGIDIQPDLIRETSRRYPHMDFQCVSIQDYSSEDPFDLISSVLVMQHNPFEEQRLVIEKMRRLLKAGGYFIMLEGIEEDKRAHYFPRTIDGWVRAFESAGFRCCAIRRYDYILLMDRIEKVVEKARSRRRSAGLAYPQSVPERSVEELAAIPASKGGGSLGSVKRVVVGMENRLESVLIRWNVALPSTSCSFLFEAV